jgi:hypothetical protein
MVRLVGCCLAGLALLVLLVGCGGRGDSSVAQTRSSTCPQGTGTLCDVAVSSTPNGPTVPDRPPSVTVARLKSCLEPSGLAVLSGSGEGASYAPSKEVIITRGKGGPGTLIAVYANAQDASHSLPRIKANLSAADSRGASSAAEQHGSVDVLWIPNPPSSADRDDVLRCLR